MTTRTDEGDRWLVERKTSDTTWETVYDFRARFTYLTYSANETADRELHRIVTGENLPDGVYRLTITAHPDFNPAPAAVLAQWEAEFPEPPGWAELNNADRGLAHNLLRGGWVYANGVGSERRTYPGVTREQLAGHLHDFRAHANGKITDEELATRTGYEIPTPAALSETTEASRWESGSAVLWRYIGDR